MRRPLLRLLIAASCVLAAGPAHAGANAPGDWHGWNDGLARAAATKKPVLVDVYTDWCGWCRRMDRDVYARDDVRKYLDANYVTVRLNAEANDPATYRGQEYTSRTIASGFRVTGFPTTVFLRANGDHIASVPGYVPPERFLLLLRFIGEGHMDRGEDFIEFTKKHGAAPATP